MFWVLSQTYMMAVLFSPNLVETNFIQKELPNKEARHQNRVFGRANKPCREVHLENHSLPIRMSHHVHLLTNQAFPGFLTI